MVVNFVKTAFSGQVEKNSIYRRDCRDVLSDMPSDFIDLTVTSPPYNVDLGNNKYNKSPYDLYRDNMGHSQYLLFLRDVFDKVYQKTKSGGRCVINIGDGQNGRVPTHSDVIHMMTRDLPWLPMGTIIWDKGNSSNRTSWGSFNSCSAPCFPTPFEYILIFAKDSLKLAGKGESDLDKDDFVKWSLEMWSFTGERKANSGHPAAFPVELPMRCIKMLSWKDSLVFDPFLGSGTTGVAAVKTGRCFVGCDISYDYCDNACIRIEKEILVEVK